jgi:hypothetical protein
MRPSPSQLPDRTQHNHLFILSPDRSQLLIEIHGKVGYLLPSVVSEAGRKSLPAVSAYLDRLGLPRDLILSFTSRESTPEGHFDSGHLIETGCDTGVEPGRTLGTLVWQSVSEVSALSPLWSVQAELLRDYLKLRPILDQLAPTESSIGHPGWTASLRSWVQAAAEKAGLGGIDDNECAPIRASRAEALLTFQTRSGPKLYVKCSSRLPFTEAAVNRILGDRYPDAVAETLDFCPARGWWIAREVPGRSLGEQLTLENCLRMIERFATIQRDLESDVAVFVGTGLSPLSLRQIDPELGAVREILGTLGALSRPELAELQERFRKPAGTLADANFPQSLVHADLAPWNIKMSGQRPVFLDWEDTTFGPAAISLEIFLATLRARRDCDPSWLEPIRNTYFNALGQSNTKWDEPEVVRSLRTAGIFCQLRDFIRCWQSEPHDAWARFNVIAVARKLYRFVNSGNS